MEGDGLCPPEPSQGILSHPAAVEGLIPPLLINPPVTPGIHGKLSLAGGHGRSGANLPSPKLVGDGNGGGGRLLLLVHNLLPISGVIQPVFQMIISKSGVAALIPQHSAPLGDYGATTSSETGDVRAS